MHSNSIRAIRRPGRCLLAAILLVSCNLALATGQNAQLQSDMPASPCSGGLANGLPCNNVGLMSHMGLADLSAMPGSASDVWGFVDLNSDREYALIGFDLGTAVIDVSDPLAPREVAFIMGQPTTWRDVKVHQFFDSGSNRWRAYAYVVADNAADGLVVLDLGGLPHAVSKLSYASDFRSAHNVYLTNTDFSTGLALTPRAPLLIVAGSDLGNGSYRAYSLANPAAPEFIGAAPTPDYMHDAASLIISDSRKDTQCQIAGPYCEILLDFNETSIEIWNITDPAAITRLSSSTYPSPGYTHSGWWSEDRQFMFVHDELDERQQALPTTMRIFSLADLRNPVQVGTWTGPTNAIDHNGFVRGNRYYLSNYSRGLSVLDITTPATPVQLGFFDPSPAAEQSVFAGVWGAFPFFPSGNIAISDLESGLYLVNDMTRAVAQGSLQFTARSVAVAEGQQAQLRVRRSGGTAGAISVDYEILPATAADGDFQALTGTLRWASGDASDKFIDIAAVNDGIAENLEQLIVRLVNPTGGATLDDGNIASVYIGDAGAPPGIGFAEVTVDSDESGFATAVLVLQRQAQATGTASVDFLVTGGDAVAGTDFLGNTTGNVSWAAGDGGPRSIEFAIVGDNASEATEFFEVTLSNAVGATVIGAATARINIADSTTAVIDPPPVISPPPATGGGGGTLGIVTLLWLGLLGLLPRVRRLSQKGGA